MQKIAKSLRLLLIVLGLIGVVVICLNNYTYIFARTVRGEIFEVRSASEGMIMAGGMSNSQFYSYAVAVKDPTNGEIVTSSSEDRQWGVAQKGLCVEAKFYPYPPWNLEKAGTYFNARLIKMYECPPGTKAPSTEAQTQN